MEYFRSSRDEESNYQDTSSLWMIIYTDMISNLVIFFLMLYGLTWLSQSDREIAAASFQEAFAGDKTAVAAAIKNIEKGLEKQKNVESMVRQEFENVEISQERIKIILPSPVLFDSGSADLKNETKQTLSEIAAIIKSMPNRVVVEGHTDNVPIRSTRFASNWELSSARAFSVIKYLIERENVDPRQISALGYGEFRPKAPNDTESNKARNRRIEINIIKIK